jgi:hypothetical protein
LTLPEPLVTLMENIYITAPKSSFVALVLDLLVKNLP